MGLLPAALLLLAAFCSTAADAQATGDWRRAAGSGGGKPWPRRRLAAEGAVERGTPLSDDWRSIVTNETLAHLLKQTASPDGIVIFTTFALLSPKPEGAPQCPTGSAAASARPAAVLTPVAPCPCGPHTCSPQECRGHAAQLCLLLATAGPAAAHAHADHRRGVSQPGAWLPPAVGLQPAAAGVVSRGYGGGNSARRAEGMATRDELPLGAGMQVAR